VPLLKPPEAAITQRRYYLRIEESLAQTMERHAEFLGTYSIDHVVAQVLQFIFKRDSQFKSWLEQHPEPTLKPARSKARSKSTEPDGHGIRSHHPETSLSRRRVLKNQSAVLRPICPARSGRVAVHQECVNVVRSPTQTHSER